MATGEANHYKAADIPPQFQPAGNERYGERFNDAAAGQADDHNEVGHANRAERKLTETLLNLGRGDVDTTESTGYLSRSGKKIDKRSTQERKKREEQDRRFAERIARQQLEDRIRDLERQIAAIDAELKDIRDRRDEISKRQTEIQSAQAALDKVEDLHAKGKLDPNNPAHAQLLRQAGLKPEDATRDDFDVLIAQRNDALRNESNGLDREYTTLSNKEESLLRKRGELVNEYDEAIAQRNRMTDDPSSIPEEVTKSNQTEAGRDTVNRAAAEMGSIQTRVQIVEAAGFDKATESYARQMTLDVDSLFSESAIISSESSTYDTGGKDSTPINAPPLKPVFAAASDPDSTTPDLIQEKRLANNTVQPIAPSI